MSETIISTVVLLFFLGALFYCVYIIDDKTTPKHTS
jgi:hypothetical protein